MAKNFWVISDPHLGHENIIRYCNRPFDSVFDMNETILHNWNTVVKDQDHIYCLGDVYMPGGFEHAGEALAFLSRLKGRKRLIVGNHDELKDPVLHKVFQKISLWYQRPDWNLLMTHVPVHETTLGPRLKVNLHGHIHNRESPSKAHINCCVEMTGYCPVNIDSLRPSGEI